MSLCELFVHKSYFHFLGLRHLACRGLQARAPSGRQIAVLSKPETKMKYILPRL